MGFLGSLFGKETAYPPLDANSSTAARFEGYRRIFEPFVGKVSDRIEFIPTDRALYAFIGKPPDAFGIVWWSNGEEHNFKTLMKAKGLTQMRVQLLSDALRDSYKKHAGDARFSASVNGKTVVVTPSDAFAATSKRSFTRSLDFTGNPAGPGRKEPVSVSRKRAGGRHILAVGADRLFAGAGPLWRAPRPRLP